MSDTKARTLPPLDAGAERPTCSERYVRRICIVIAVPGGRPSGMKMAVGHDSGLRPEQGSAPHPVYIARLQAKPPMVIRERTTTRERAWADGMGGWPAVTSLIFGAVPEPSVSLTLGAGFVRAVPCRFEHADQISVPPSAPRPATHTTIDTKEAGNGRSRRRAAPLGAGGRAGHRQGHAGGLREGAGQGQPGPACPGGAQLRHHQEGDPVLGRLVASTRWKCGDGVHVRLLEGAVFPPGSRGLLLRAVRRQAGKGAPRAAQDGPGRLRMAGQGGREGHGGQVLRAPRGDPPAAHAHPLPPAPDRGALREKRGPRSS